MASLQGAGNSALAAGASASAAAPGRRTTSASTATAVQLSVEDLLAESEDDDEDEDDHPHQAAGGGSAGMPIPSGSSVAAQRMTALQAMLDDEDDSEDDEAHLSATTAPRPASLLPTTPLVAASSSPVSASSRMVQGSPPSATLTAALERMNSVGGSGSGTTSRTSSKPMAVPAASPPRPTSVLAATVPSSLPVASSMSASLQSILHESDSDDEDLPPVRTSRQASRTTSAVNAQAPVPMSVAVQPLPVAPSPAASPVLQSQPAPAPTPSPSAPVVPTISVAASLVGDTSSDSDEEDLTTLQKVGGGSASSAAAAAAAAAAAILEQDSSDEDIDGIPSGVPAPVPRGHNRAISTTADTKATGTPATTQPQLISELDLSLIANPLTRAEALEQNLATLGNYQLLNPLAQAQAQTTSQRKHASRATASGASSSATATNLARLVKMDRISVELERLRPSIGLASVCCTHSKLFAFGTSRGVVVLFDHFEAQLMALGKPEDLRVRGAITAIDINQGGDQLAVGYSKGAIAVWDINNKAIIKLITDVTTAAICAIRFTKPDQGSHKVWTFVACDTLGCLNHFTLTKQLFSVGLDKQVLLQGKAGPVLATSVLSACPGFPHLCDHFAIVALSTETVTSIISLEPSVQIIHRIAREATERVGVLPVLAWRTLQQRDQVLNDPAAQAQGTPTTAFEAELARHPVLAMARGKSLTLLQIAPITDKAELATLAATTAAGEKPRLPLRFTTLHTQTFAKDIKSVSWLGHGAVLAVILAPNDEMLLLDPYTLPLRPLATIDGRSVGIVHSEFFSHPVTGAPELSFTPSISSIDVSLLLLGCDAVSELRVLPWNERLDALIHHTQTNDPHWIDALALALDFYHGTARAPVGLPRDLRQVQVRLRDKMIELIGNFIHVMLQAKEGGVAGAGVEKSYLRILGGTCIAYCISIARFDILFGEIYDQFKYHLKHEFAGGAAPVSPGTELFLELLEPYVLQDQLPVLPASILGDLFALYAHKKRLPQLEQMLLHLNPLGLDLAFLLPLCTAYRLFSATIYLFNRGHSAFHAPLEEVLGTLTLPSNLGLLAGASAGASTASPLGPLSELDKSKMSYKLLLYIDYCFRGRTFPRKATELPKTYCAAVRAQVLSVLFRKNVTTRADIAAAGVAGGAAPDAGGLQLPDYPYLSYFLNVSASQFLDILAQVFEGDEEWMDYIDGRTAEVPEEEEKAPTPSTATPPPAQTPPHSRQASSSLLFGLGAPVTPVTPAPTPSPAIKKRPTHLLKASHVPTRQAMLDALLYLMLDQLQYSPPSHSTSHAALLLPFTYQSRGADDAEHLSALFRFAARFLARGVVTASPSFVNRIFTHLCEAEAAGASSAASPRGGIEAANEAGSGTGVGSAASAVQDLVLEQSDRQATLLSLLARVAPADLEVESLLLRVRAAGFWMVQAYLTLVGGRRDFARTLDALLRAVEAQERTVLPRSLLVAPGAKTAAETSPEGASVARALSSLVGKSPCVALFDFIHACITDPALSANGVAALRTATLQRLPELVKAASDRTARLILADFNTEHERVVAALNAFPELQFRYLQSIMTGHTAEKDEPSADKSSQASGPVDIHSSSLTSGRLASASTTSHGLSHELSMTELLQRSGLQFPSRVHELYIKLLCTYAPGSVLSHLSSHQDFNIESALKLCQEFRVDDAAAFLLERTGDVQGALELMLRAVDQRVLDLRRYLDGAWRAYPLPASAGGKGGKDTLAVPSDVLRRLSSADSAPHPTALASASLLGSTEYSSLNKQLLNTINTATLLCQRTANMDAEKLWFALLDRFVTLLRTIKQQQQQLQERRPVAPVVQSAVSAQITALPMEPAVVEYLQSCLYSYVRLVLSSMMSHLDLSSLLIKITTDHQSDTLREFRETIQGLLDTYAYEESILATANNLLASDKFHSIVVLHKKKAAAFSPQSDACGCCARAIADAGQAAAKFILFDCGHIFHESCLGKQSGSCMICQRETASSKKRTASSGSTANRKGVPGPSPSPPAASPIARAETSRRPLSSSDDVIHQLEVAERRFKKGSVRSVSAFDKKLRRFGRGGLDEDDANDDDFGKPLSGAASSPFGNSGRSSIGALPRDEDDFDFRMPSMRSSLTIAPRLPGAMSKPARNKTIDFALE